MSKESDGFVRAIARGFSIIEALGKPPGRYFTLRPRALGLGLSYLDTLLSGLRAAGSQMSIHG